MQPVYPHRLDLAGYLSRLGWSGHPHADVATLRALHRAHVQGIPFENLQALMGLAPSLALGDLQEKLVRGSRGGYCYEHNTLFAAVLEALGFGVARLTARVRVGSRGAIRPRTHMLLLVDVPGEDRQFVADVGFGNLGGLLEAIELVANTEVQDGICRHRLVSEPYDGPSELWVLQALLDGVWADQYAFTREPFVADDFEVVNWHMSTNPRSPFRRTLYAHRSRPDADLALAGRTLVITRADGSRRKRELSGPAEVRQVLADDFGIDLPAAAETHL
ncbi:arylamine N-acetyltransferase [Actinacidiphila glaucinigra]|uniref:arylamine N-acetyltransferase family protein n=1 Tax=Actinacidiphila glaucinigra TaxID=235986 RepID=UPI0036AD29D0